MKRYSFLLVGLLTLPVVAGTLSYRNDREGESYYAGKTYNREIYNVLQEVDGKEIIKAYQTSLASMTEQNVCAFNINSMIEKRMLALRPQFQEMMGAIYYLRSQNEIDDVATRILLSANTVVNTTVTVDENSRLPSDKEALAKMLKVITDAGKSNGCLDDSYRTMLGELKKIDKNADSSLSALLVKAYNQNMISALAYTSFQQARVNELENSWNTLRSYGNKIRSLRANRPITVNDSSDFVTDRAEKMKMSRRQRLMEFYNDFQIMLMADVVKKLRRRLESDRAEILVYRKDELDETITLDPMERFRMAIKLLRKEMALLANNTYFNGRAPDYMDLMVASYEVGIVPSVELKEIAGIQDIWNPKKSFWDKAQTWVRGAGSIATIVLPPPFGFIPTLGIVVIEMTTKKNTTNQDDPTRIF